MKLPSHNSAREMTALELTEDVLEEISCKIVETFLRGQVREVDFMPTFTPPFVLFDSHVLGIGMTVLKPLYKYSYSRLLSSYHSLKSKGTCGDPSDAYRYSFVALAVKGDLPMAYSARKHALLSSPEKAIEEIMFLQAIFSKHPKSPGAWEHRRWCLRFIHDVVRQRTGELLKPAQIETEKVLCSASAEKYPKNYYAWLHRLWLLPHMSVAQVGFSSMPQLHCWNLSAY